MMAGNTRKKVIQPRLWSRNKIITPDVLKKWNIHTSLIVNIFDGDYFINGAIAIVWIGSGLTVGPRYFKHITIHDYFRIMAATGPRKA